VKQPTLDCAQIAPKNIENYRKPSKNIERDRKRKSFKKSLFTGEIHYFLRFRFDCGRLHTVEVTGSNPVSPTGLSSKRLPHAPPDWSGGEGVVNGLKS